MASGLCLAAQCVFLGEDGGPSHSCLGIDPGTLSKAASGQARMSEDHMDALMDACGSEAWLHYWMLKRGYDPRCLRRIETDLERENRELREKLKKVEDEREVELRLWSKLRPT